MTNWGGSLLQTTVLPTRKAQPSPPMIFIPSKHSSRQNIKLDHDTSIRYLNKLNRDNKAKFTASAIKKKKDLALNITWHSTEDGSRVKGEHGYPACQSFQFTKEETNGLSMHTAITFLHTAINTANRINVQSTEPTKGLLATALCTETRSVSNKPSLLRRYTPEPTSYCLQRVNPHTKAT